MADPKADIILHPIRMRLIQCFVAGAPLTAQQLQERLPDIPQATLYRHVKKLHEAGILVITEERPNRGTVEKVYALPEHGADISAEELRKASPDDHLTYFMKFASHLIGQYGRYVQLPDMDVVRDGVSYRQATLHLSDEEHHALLHSIRELLTDAMKKESTVERRPRLYSTVVFPEAALHMNKHPTED